MSIKLINIIKRKFSPSKIIAVISPFINIFEKRALSKYNKVPLKHHPIFIVGAPRTGSTILYQILTNRMDALYIDNFVCRFFQNLFFGFWLKNIIYKQKAHNNFFSKYGNTTEGGPIAPSECGNFWYRWLPKDHHFIDYHEITDKMVDEIRKEITAIINYYDRPLIIKNLNAGQRLRLIVKCFPSAKLIFMKRDPLFTSQSILLAKRKLGKADNEFWSVKPNNFQSLLNLKGVEQVVHQIYYIEKQIHVDSNLFGKDNLLEVSYRELYTNQEKTISEILDFVGSGTRKNYKNSKISHTEKQILDDKEFSILKNTVKKFDWDNYSGS